MKTLITLNICGVQVPVIEKKLKNLDGHYIPKKQVISINNKLTPYMFQTTLMHEIIHAIIHLHCESLIETIKDMKCSEKIEEEIVVSLSMPLLDLFKANPKLKPMLFKKQKKEEKKIK